HDARGNPAHRLELGLVTGKLGGGGQLAMNEEVCDFLEFAGVGDVENVVPAIMQVVAGASYGAQRGVAGHDAGKRDRLLGFRGGGRVFAHGRYLWGDGSGCLTLGRGKIALRRGQGSPFANSASSFFS